MVAMCAAAIGIAAGCRQPAPPAPLLPNPDSNRSDPAREKYAASFNAAAGMTLEDAVALEAEWNRNPEDLDALQRLLIFYRPDFSGKPVPNADRVIAARSRLILWLVAHHPDAPLAHSIHARIFAEPSEWLRDVEGYEAAKKLWLEHAARPDVSAETLANAAWSLEVSDKPLAERLLLKGQVLHPGPMWSERLGTLYAQALVGSSSLTLNNVIRSVSLEQAHSAYADDIRRKLEESGDARLLSATGAYLVNNANQTTVDFDHAALGTRYLERALALDPTDRQAQVILEWLRDLEWSKRRIALLGRTTGESRLALISRLPENEQLRILIREANEEYMRAEAEDWQAKQSAGPPEETRRRREDAERRWQGSKLYARRGLDLARRLPEHPYSPDAVFQANIALGANAFREGDRQTAVRYMLAASAAPSSRIQSSIPIVARDGSLEGRLIGELLKHGERETVIEYYERLARAGSPGAERRQKAADAIRNGYWPAPF